MAVALPKARAQRRRTPRLSHVLGVQLLSQRDGAGQGQHVLAAAKGEVTNCMKEGPRFHYDFPRIYALAAWPCLALDFAAHRAKKCLEAKSCSCVAGAAGVSGRGWQC